MAESARLILPNILPWVYNSRRMAIFCTAEHSKPSATTDHVKDAGRNMDLKPVLDREVKCRTRKRLSDTAMRYL
jgi:hypothetical protein